MKLEFGLTDKQLAFADSLNHYNVTGYGGAKGGGKSHGGRIVPILRCLETPGHVGALFRRSYPELQDNHIGPLFRDYPGLRDFYNAGEKSLRFPSLESEFKFRYCENLADVDKQAGREYHTLIIEEAGDWEYECALRLIRNTNRSSRAGVKATAGLMFNWGGVAHGWLRRIFWERRLHPNEQKLTWNFILAKVEDNPKLMEHDPGYLARLEAEPNEALRRAHRHGDPDIVAGQYFTELSRDVHVIKPFDIPKHWKWFGAYDYGFNHPAVWLFFVADEDGNCYLVHEIYKAGQYIETQANAVNDYLKQIQARPLFYAGHDCWAVKKAGDPTIAEDFVKHRIILTRANINRILGAKHVREYLRHGPNRPPRVFFFDTCPLTLGCLQRMIHDPKDLEDVLKVDSSNGDPETGDDGYDCFTPSTPILTDKGERPIKDIRVGDFVLTRGGYREVVNARKSHEAARVLKLTLSDGRSLTATPNHPIWVAGKGFVRLDALSYGDEVLDWRIAKQSSLTASNLGATQNLPCAPTAFITGPGATTARPGLAHCIVRFGKTLMALSPRAITSTIRTEIRSITSFLTSLVLAPKPTLASIGHLSAWNDPGPTSPAFAPWLAAGTNPKKGVPGISSTQKSFGKIASQPPSIARSAGSLTKQDTPAHPVFATPIVKCEPAPQGSPPSAPMPNAPNAAPHFGLSDSISANAPIRVVSVTEAGVSATYLLSVAEHHEYFANGILVKNCFRYGLMSRPPIAIKPISPTLDRYRRDRKSDRPSWITA